MPDKPSPNRPDYSLLIRVWNIGSTILVLAFMGWWLDYKFHTFYRWTLAGAALGLLYCFYEAWRAFKED